ncbi:MAG: hypothetical protein QW709_04410 [Thermoplasmata archaeon]
MQWQNRAKNKKLLSIFVAFAIIFVTFLGISMPGAHQFPHL